eukprot:10369290-Heterocapsa_arctica.AAC.1
MAGLPSRWAVRRAHQRAAQARRGDSNVDPVAITQKVVECLYTGISTPELDTLAAETCAYMSQRHPDFSTLAARIA